MTSQGGVRWTLLIMLTAAGTAVGAALGVPSPALFAGLLVAAGLALLGRAPEHVPRAATTAAQAVIGVVIGVLAQPGTLAGLATQWPPMLAAGLATLALSMGAGLLLGLRGGVSPLTGMLALTAGGASGLVAISRELGGDDRVVAVVQYLRVGMVTATMPVVAAVVFGATIGATHPSEPRTAGPVLDIAFLLGCVAVGVLLARAARVPAGALLGPMTVAIAANLSGWSFGAAPPTPLVEIAYAVIGWQAGARFDRESLRTVLGVLAPATALITGVIAGCAALGVLLSALTGATPLEGYLATTPGGVYAVLATAISAGTDVTFVVAVQVLRLVIMLLVAPVVARVAGRRGPDPPRGSVASPPMTDHKSSGSGTPGSGTGIAVLSVVALDCPEPHALARFYSALTGAPIARDDGDWVQLAATGGVALAFQRAPGHVPPEWPGDERPQQLHLDFDVPDLDEAEPRVLALGARKHEVQPGTSFRVYLDPAGHPFCLVKAGHPFG